MKERRKTLLNNRIKSSHVQLGDSFFLDPSKKNRSVPELHKNQEEGFKKNLEELLLEASKEGKVIIQQAEAQAADILKNAEQQVQNLCIELDNLKNQTLEAAYAEGFQKGYEDGNVRTKQEILSSIQGIGALSESVSKVKTEILNSAEKEILDL